MQKWLVEASLVLFSHKQHTKVWFSKRLRQILFLEAVVHLDLTINFLCDFVVFHSSGERHKTLDGVAFFFDVTVELLLVSNSFQT
ncbi:hypothetical protein D3C77_304490 [compost metagenome]